MSEIKSLSAIVDSYIARIKTANAKLASENIVVYDDDITNLSVNNNSTKLNLATAATIVSISSQISTDCERISSIAELFEEKDQSLAGGH